jgi:dienelactone hydrolase
MHGSATNEPHYEPFGWHQWPDDMWMSYQFRRGLGETQEGGGAVGEAFLAASRMTSNDFESWYREWMVVADRNMTRGDDELAKGHVRTAMNCWLRAANYYRQAEFWLKGDDPRRMEAFERAERCSANCFSRMTPKAEIVEIPYEAGTPLPAYFIRSPNGGDKQPVLISVGGLDSYKDELWFMTGRGAVQRGMSVLMVDGPGQGGALRRHKLTTRYDYEVPIGKCIDWLLKRGDVDPSRIALSGSSLGGYYAARAASKEHRIAACISHGAIWKVHERWKLRDDTHGLANQIKWVFGVNNMQEAAEASRSFDLEGVLGGMKCPYLIINGSHDVLSVEACDQVYQYALSQDLNVTMRLTNPEETGADHCQHDNPTIGQELMLDWLTDVFGIDQTTLKFYAG